MDGFNVKTEHFAQEASSHTADFCICKLQSNLDPGRFLPQLLPLVVPLAPLSRFLGAPPVPGSLPHCQLDGCLLSSWPPLPPDTPHVQLPGPPSALTTYVPPIALPGGLSPSALQACSFASSPFFPASPALQRPSLARPPTGCSETPPFPMRGTKVCTG